MVKEFEQEVICHDLTNLPQAFKHPTHFCWELFHFESETSPFVLLGGVLHIF